MSFGDQEIDDRIFSTYGRAFCRAQTLEWALQSVILLYNKEVEKLSTKEYNFILENKKTAPLGKLIEKLGVLKKEKGLQRSLIKVNQWRNFLAHEYFWSRSNDLHTAEGREAGLAELENCIDYFSRVSERLIQLMVAWAEKTSHVNGSFLLGLKKHFGDDYLKSSYNWVFERPIIIHAPPYSIWKLLTDPILGNSLGGCYLSDWQVNSSIHFRSWDGSIRMRGIIHEIDEGKLLHFGRYHWDEQGNFLPDFYSHIRYELRPNGIATTLCVREEFANPLSDEEFEVISENWNSMLVSYRGFLARERIF